MELFETIRREHRAGETIKALATKHGIHRRMVRQAIASAIPPERKKPARAQPSIGPLKERIDEMLKGDLTAPRKQRHTAHRIWVRLKEEYPERPVAEATVRRHVALRKREIGLSARDLFVPQSYRPGEEAQVDWFEAAAKLGGVVQTLQFFSMRSMASGDAFHRAYTNATQQAFLEAHEHAFAFLGGVFRKPRYDNLTLAVKKILRGRQRIETDRVIAFRSHWGFTTEYCNPASGNEKGGVEGELGRFRRNWLVPVPEATDLPTLNEWLLEGCEANRERTISGHRGTIGEAGQGERPFLLPLVSEGFPIDELLFPVIVDGKGRVKVKNNWYSAPVWPGTRVSARVWPSRIEIEQNGKRVAAHARSYGHGEQILNLEHYLDVLEKKPGAMAGSTPLEQWRQAGRWPECMDRMWKKLEQRHGRSVGTREMIGLIRAGVGGRWQALVAAVDEALRLGISDAAAVLHMLQWPDAEHRQRYALNVSAELARYERPQPLMDEYDRLLATEVIQ